MVDSHLEMPCETILEFWEMFVRNGSNFKVVVFLDSRQLMESQTDRHTGGIESPVGGLQLLRVFILGKQGWFLLQLGLKSFSS